MKIFISPLLCALFLAAIAGPVSAATFYLELNQSSTTWNQASDWNTATDGTGTDAVAGDYNNAANIFDTEGRVLRTVSSSSAFGSATLLLNSGSGNGMIVRSGSTGNTVANLQSKNGRITSGVGDAYLNITNFNNIGGVFLKPEDGSARTLRLNIGTLTGSGNMSIQNGTSGTANLVLGISTSASSYTGNILFTGNAVNLTLGTSFISGGGLVLNDSNSRLTLADGANVTFTSLSINSIALAPNTYTWAELSAMDDAFANQIFQGSSTGTITIVPEPGAGSLTPLIALGGVLRFRRRLKGR